LPDFERIVSGLSHDFDKASLTAAFAMFDPQVDEK